MKRTNTIPLTQSTTITSYGSKRSKASTSRQRKPATTSLVRFPGYGFPPKLQVKHKYSDNLVLSSAAGNPVTYNFRCNGMYDPDFTGTGHQPLYFDQLGALYDHFTILRSKIKLTFAASSSDPQMVNVFQNDDTTTTPTLLVTRDEQSLSKTAVLASGQTKEIVLYFSAQRTFGGSILANDNLQGTPSADPTEQSIWTVSCQAIDSSKANACNLLVEIEYEAVWDELKDIATS